MLVFTVHQVRGRPVGLTEIGGDMRGAALESPARSLRCSERVIGRLLFLSLSLPLSPLLPGVFSSSRPTDPFFFFSSHPFESPNMYDRYKRSERLQRCKERKRKGRNVRQSYR